MSSKSLGSQHSETRPTPTFSSVGATSTDSFVDSCTSCVSVPEMTLFSEPFSEEIYNMTYKYGDETVDETFARVAKYLATVEKESDRHYWENQFRKILTNFQFVTGGRIMSNAGTGLKNTTLINCYVSGFQGEDKDSLHSIFDELARQGKILASEGGYGFCVDILRPRGAFVCGIGSESPGAVEWLNVWDTQSATITSGSGKKSDHKGAKQRIRKGAQMVTMSCWHPDIVEFITAKQTPNKLTKFNMSVLITEKFMNAVEKHLSWNLEFPDYEKHRDEYHKFWDGNLELWKNKGFDVKVYKIFNDANELWEIINQSTYNRNEPGVIFIDTVNKMNNLWYCEHINATNPCLTGDTLILTDGGEIPIHELVGKQFTAIVNNEPFLSTSSGFWCTGEKEVLEITLENGIQVRATENHKFIRNGEKFDVKNLKIGDELELAVHNPDKTLVENDDKIGHKIKISKISQIGVQPVFDCTIAGPHEFSANGIRSGNCSEQLLPIGGVCLLGSLNLVHFIDLLNKNWNYDKLAQYIPIAIRMLDNVNDLTYVPLPEQEWNLKNKRRIGLGIMGYGSALMMMKLRYGSIQSLKITEELMLFIVNTAYNASIDLAIEKCKFPLYDEKYLDSNFLKVLSPATKDRIKSYGIRNSHLMSIQPTGNSSVVANNVSGGLEPLFLTEYIRTTIFPFPPQDLILPTNIDWINKTFVLPTTSNIWTWTMEGDDNLLRTSFNNFIWKIDKNRGLVRETVVKDYAVRWLQLHNEWDPHENYVATTEELTVDDHLNVMKVFAKYVCSSISKTCNVPNNYSYEDFKNYYLQAYKTGYIKGVTTYRAGTMMHVLSNINSSTKKSIIARPRPEILDCDVHIIKKDGENWAVLIGMLDNRPYEVFCFKPRDISFTENLKHGKLRKVIPKYGDTYYNFETDYFVIQNVGFYFERHEEEALTRMISTALKHGADINYIYNQLQKSKGTIVSFAKAIARALVKYVTSIEDKKCQNCGDNQGLIFAEGCVKCKNCGSSKCG